MPPLASARAEAAAQRLNFAVNRAYCACFYVASAVLLSEGRTFVKHTGVRAALHQHLVKSGRIDPELGRSYDLLFQRRGEADYAELVTFDEARVAELIRKAEDFVAAMDRFLSPEV